MCGIAGIQSFHSSAPFLIRRMNAALAHRGPDGSEIYADKQSGTYLSHNRLAIIDLSQRARQPFFNETGDVAAVVNGEIYNFLELKQLLTGRGHRFYSGSDSEVIVHAYEEWGEDFVNRLDGMFAFALWDRNNQKLILARDPLGIKPLYYFSNKEDFIFSSEVRAFLSLTDDIFPREINLEAAQALLAFPYVVDDHTTILHQVKKLPPGHYLILQNQALTLKRYWSLESQREGFSGSYSDACRILDEKLSLSVSSHLRSDVEIGIFLSGGVDSGLIAALAAKKLQKPFRAFTAYFQNPRDENVDADKTASDLGIECVPILIGLRETADQIDDILWNQDDLSSTDAGFITLYFLAKEARSRGVKVVLNGEGADEIFGGYPWFRFAGPSYSYLPAQIRNSLLYFRISKNLLQANSWQNVKDFQNLINGFSKKDIFRQISRFELRYQLPNHLLMKVDKATMAHGVETRVPYLSRDVVEFVDRLPSQFKRPVGGVEKRILRAVARNYLPQETAGRNKRGFLFPVSEFISENKGKVRDYLLQSSSFSGRFFHRVKIRGLLDSPAFEPYFLKKSKGTLLWKLFVLETWHKKYREVKLANNCATSNDETLNCSCIER